MFDFLEKVGLAVAAIVFGAGVCLLTATPVYFLWNWLLPDLFNFPEITYWQSLGITFLCDILFKSHTSISKKD